MAGDAVDKGKDLLDGDEDKAPEGTPPASGGTAPPA